MNPLTYSLCQKPVLGLVMFVTSMCAFPPLFYAEPLPLQRAGASLVKEFEAPISKPYFLELGFTFPSAATMRNDKVVGTFDASCPGDAATRGIPIHVLVRNQANGVVAIDKTFDARCVTSGSEFTKTRAVARLDLAAGRYVIEARNVESQAGLDGVKTTLSLVAGHGK